jgi:hypothetical protein
MSTNTNAKRAPLTDAEWAVYTELQQQCNKTAMMHAWSASVADYAIAQGIVPEAFAEAMQEAAGLFQTLNELLIEYAQRIFPGRVVRSPICEHKACATPSQNAPAPAKIGGGN